MLRPSDFNSAVPQFTNGDYASNPINPQYIAEPSAEDYNRGSEPLQTLPAQWWNWFLNKFTNRFNKVNIYVKNIFNELTQLLSLVSVTPSGTEGTPTVGQLKDMFETKYPDYLKTTAALSNTYVPQTTKVNGHALSENITITCVACAGANGSGTAFGTAATVNTGTAVGCIPIVGTALGTTDGQFLATDTTGKLKPSGYSASSFRSSSWTPTLVACACYGKNGNSYSAFGSNAFNSTAFTTCTGTVTSINIYCGTTCKCGITSSGSICLGTNAFNSTSFTTCTGTVTSIKFQCAGTDKCTITSSGTINLSANAWNTNATISTTTYPGACCTGTLTSSSGCAYDSARLGGTAASSYLKTTGCAADSAKLGNVAASCYLQKTGCAADSAKLQGKTISSIWDMCIPYGTNCNISISCINRISGPRIWSLCTSVKVCQCYLYKVFLDVLHEFCGQRCVCSMSCEGSSVTVYEAPVQGVFRDNNGYHYATHVRRDWICCGGTSLRPILTPGIVLIDCTNPSSVYCSQRFCCVNTSTACLCAGTNIIGYWNI